MGLRLALVVALATQVAAQGAEMGSPGELADPTEYTEDQDLPHVGETDAITDTQKFGEIAKQFVPDAITHLDQSFAYFRECGAKCLIPDDKTTIETRKETEYVRDQWDIFSYAYAPEPQIGGSDPWPVFRELIESLHKDIGDIKDLAGKKGKAKKLDRLRNQVMGEIKRYHDLVTSLEWIGYFQTPSVDKMYHRTEEQQMSALVWGGNIQYWFGPNTNRPVPSVRLTGKDNLAALMQLELYRLQTFYMNVMSADLSNITTLTDLYEVKEAIHDTRKEIRIVSHQIQQFPEVFVNSSLAKDYDGQIHKFYSKVFTPVLEKLRLWEKANTHHAPEAEEAKTRDDFLEAVKTLHDQQMKLAPEDRFNFLLEKTRANVLPVTVPEDPEWAGTEIVNPPPLRYWPLYLGVGAPILLAVCLVISYFNQRNRGFGENSYQYLEEYGRNENLPTNYGTA